MLSDGEDVQGKPASQRYHELINLGETGGWGWSDVGVSKQEKESVVGVALVVTGRSVVTAGPRGTTEVSLRLKPLQVFP